jgi:hypothetical protein
MKPFIFNCCICFEDFEWPLHYGNTCCGFVCCVCNEGRVCINCVDKQYTVDVSQHITTGKANYKIAQPPKYFRGNEQPFMCPICKCGNYREYLTNNVLLDIVYPNINFILKNPCFKYLLRNSDQDFVDMMKYLKTNQEKMMYWVRLRFYNVLKEI